MSGLSFQAVGVLSKFSVNIDPRVSPLAVTPAALN